MEKNVQNFYSKIYPPSILFLNLSFVFSIRLVSRGCVLLSTVLPPPSISPLHHVLDVAYNREYNMMFLLVNEQEIWVYYTRFVAVMGVVI